MSVLEVAKVRVDPARTEEFESAFAEAIAFVRAAHGHRDSQLTRVLETPGEYLFLVTWEDLADHTERFTASDGFRSFVAVLEPYFREAPEAVHVTTIIEKENSK